MSRRFRAGLVVAAAVASLVVVAAFAWLVWPTEWQYHEMKNVLVREHRWSGRLEVLTSGQGWVCRANCETGSTVHLTDLVNPDGSLKESNPPGPKGVGR